MDFINEVAEIIHDFTSQSNGYAYKNGRDSFLVIWKFADEYVYFN